MSDLTKRLWAAGGDHRAGEPPLEHEAAHVIAEQAKRIAQLEAEVERLNKAVKDAVTHSSDWAAKCGEAEGKLRASELPGVLEGWQRRAETAEAERDFALRRFDAVNEELEKVTAERDACLHAINEQLEHGYYEPECREHFEKFLATISALPVKEK